jgi:hypothetical protein
MYDCIILSAVIPDVIFEFEQLALSASEGNAAVVCVSAMYNNEFPPVVVFSTNLSAIAGTAGEKN